MPLTTRLLQKSNRRRLISSNINTVVLQTKTLLFLRLIPANQRYTSMSKLERKAPKSVFLISQAASILMFRNFKVTVVARTLVRIAGCKRTEVRATFFEVEKAMEGHILAKIQLMGRYKRLS